METEKNNAIDNNSEENNTEVSTLNEKQQKRCFSVGIIIGSTLIACVGGLACIMYWDKSEKGSNLPLTAYRTKRLIARKNGTAIVYQYTECDKNSFGKVGIVREW